MSKGSVSLFYRFYRIFYSIGSISIKIFLFISLVLFSMIHFSRCKDFPPSPLPFVIFLPFNHFPGIREH